MLIGVVCDHFPNLLKLTINHDFTTPNIYWKYKLGTGLLWGFFTIPCYCLDTALKSPLDERSLHAPCKGKL